MVDAIHRPVSRRSSLEQFFSMDSFGLPARTHATHTHAFCGCNYHAWAPAVLHRFCALVHLVLQFMVHRLDAHLDIQRVF